MLDGSLCAHKRLPVRVLFCCESSEAPSCWTPPLTPSLALRRYTAWLNYTEWDASTYGPLWDTIVGEELYDHRAADTPGGAGGDPGLSYDDSSESNSVAADPAFSQIKSALQAALKAAFPQRSEKA